MGGFAVQQEGIRSILERFHMFYCSLYPWKLDCQGVSEGWSSRLGIIWQTTPAASNLRSALLNRCVVWYFWFLTSCIWCSSQRNMFQVTWSCSFGHRKLQKQSRLTKRMENTSHTDDFGLCFLQLQTTLSDHCKTRCFKCCCLLHVNYLAESHFNDKHFFQRQINLFKTTLWLFFLQWYRFSIL